MSFFAVYGAQYNVVVPLFLCGIKKMSAKVITMFQKSGEFIHTQAALDLKVNPSVIARKMRSEKDICCISKAL